MKLILRTIGMKKKTWLPMLLLPLAVAAILTCSRTGPNEQATTAQSTSDDAEIERNRKLLETNPDDQTARDNLKRLIDRANPISDEKSQRVRDILRRFARPGKLSLIRKDEPGEPLAVSGSVRNAAGKAIAGAVLYIFHADAQGQYTRSDVMNEPNARLFSFMKTDADGRFEFSTIRPGGYPGRADRQGEKWRIPQHIHLQVTAEGYQVRNLQMVFEDDPRMTPYWHQWASTRGHPVVTVSRDRQGVQHAACDIILQSQ